MSTIDRMIGWLRALAQRVATVFDKKTHRYDVVEYVSLPPELDAVKKGVIYVVQANGHLRWTMFRCPCGCREVITLSLQQIHAPHWRLLTSSSSVVSFRPSVWRQEGCRSHFWIAEGKVRWC